MRNGMSPIMPPFSLSLSLIINKMIFKNCQLVIEPNGFYLVRVLNNLLWCGTLRCLPQAQLCAELVLEVPIWKTGIFWV